MKKKKYYRQSEQLKKLMKKYPYYPEQQNNYKIAQNDFSPKCCQNCPNNPKNNPYASGICCCSLPDQEMFKW